jgi:hypothetical protein
MKEIRARIRCGGMFHTVGINQDGRPFVANHDKEEIQAVMVAEMLGGISENIPCFVFLDAAKDCIKRGRLPNRGEFPGAIEDFFIKRRARKMARLRHDQSHLMRRVRMVLQRAETASKEEIERLEDVLLDVENEVFCRFGGEHTSFLIHSHLDAESRLEARRTQISIMDDAAECA